MYQNPYKVNLQSIQSEIQSIQSEISSLNIRVSVLEEGESQSG